jgi:hypothetical protein
MSKGIGIATARRCDCQGYEALRGYGRMGMLPSRTESADRQGGTERPMRLLSYCRPKKGRGLDAVLSPAGQVIVRIRSRHA